MGHFAQSTPGNIFGKNFNKASFQKFPAKK